jgi:hypothetical protein
MLKLLERNAARVAERLVILAPRRPDSSTTFRSLTADRESHDELLRDVQRFRGNIYMNDGALRPEQLTIDGRHKTPEDDLSWHLVLRGSAGEITGCIWYLEHQGAPELEHMRVRECALARKGVESRTQLAKAIRTEVDNARRDRIRCAEVGGWAVGKGSKPTDCLMAVLATYALSQLQGGALVIATATARHCSAPILRRMGGAPMQADGVSLSPYYDERYKCEMELLRFDTRKPTARFARLVDGIRNDLATVPVISKDESVASRYLPSWTHAALPTAVDDGEWEGVPATV